MRPAWTSPTTSTTRRIAASSSAAGCSTPWWKRTPAPWAAASRTSSWWLPMPAKISWPSARLVDTRRIWDRPRPGLRPAEFHTPGRKTIADVAEFTGLPETSQMKSLVLVAAGKPVLVMLRGDHQLSETKFAAKMGVAEFRPAQPDEIRQWFGADPLAD